MTFHITAVTTAKIPNKIDVMVASKSPVSTYPSAVVPLVAGCNLSGASVILEALRGSQTLAANAAAIVLQFILFKVLLQSEDEAVEPIAGALVQFGRRQPSASGQPIFYFSPISAPHRGFSCLTVRRETSKG
jgi:hypothetical protein